ncbi:unnamed protein product [Microthlaspi erraticum]|uniref:Glycosyl transferase family 28 C-terminal domain-containing protein n=1 Tax=Microthlaspi erraticum TaxID=1685480 RepID=A0A6D2ICR4_9BRAS|nr:unnamed protein product [Microthlaspi erraticum]
MSFVFLSLLIHCDGADGSLVVDHFTFSSSIADYIRSASLVISHAGSGSILKTLKLGKPLIVVVNEDLMDNHQCELAEELQERKHLYCARPRSSSHASSSRDEYGVGVSGSIYSGRWNSCCPDYRQVSWFP